jgi:hypothetical protein
MMIQTIEMKKRMAGWEVEVMMVEIPDLDVRRSVACLVVERRVIRVNCAVERLVMG